MGYNISEKSFDQYMHIVRDVHFDVDKYKVGELYVINNTLEGIADNDDIKTFQGSKVIGQLVKANMDSLIFEVPVYFKDPNTGGIYSFEHITLSIDTIINYRIEIERLLTESEADFRTVNMISQGQIKDIIPEPDKSDDKYKGDLSIYAGLPTTPPSHIIEQLKSDIHAAYKINTPEEATEIAKYSQMNIVDDILRAAEEEKKNYVVWLTSIYDGLSKPFPILDSEGNFDPEPFKGLTNGSGRVRVKLVKGNSTIQFNVLSKYIKVTSDAIVIMKNKNKSSICMTLMRDNFREMFDKIEFEQIL